jgi:hypothetical protein
MGGASLAARLDAVFGALGALGGSTAPEAAAPSWTVREDVKPFSAGKGLEDYNYSSDEDAPQEGPMTAKMIDSDQEDEDDEDAHKCRMQATAHFRKAFEQEEEEDEWDRFATHTLAMQRSQGPVRDWDRPSGTTEVRRGLGACGARLERCT